MAGTGEKKLFMQIWQEREHVSFVPAETGRPLLLLPPGHPQWHWQFAHVLPKGLYGKARLSKENIVLLTPGQHELYDKRPHLIKSLDNYKKLFDLRDELKEKYHAGWFD